jgi:hypothetical protein
VELAVVAAWLGAQIFFDAEGRELTRHQGFLSKEGILASDRTPSGSLRSPRPIDDAVHGSS